MARPEVDTGDGVVVAAVRDIEWDGDGDGVTVNPSARLTLEPPSIVIITSKETQMAFARGREPARRAHLSACCLGAGWMFFTSRDSMGSWRRLRLAVSGKSDRARVQMLAPTNGGRASARSGLKPS